MLITELGEEGTTDDDRRTIGLDIEPTYGDPVQLEGRYEVDPIPGGKRFQGAWLVLEDGTRYVIAYRPVAKYFQFIDKRVRIGGRPYTPGRDTQHIQATHLEVHSIELAPGETPYASPPTEWVAPPLARTAGDLAARDGRWAQVVGTLEALRRDPDGYLGIAQLRLTDSTRVRVCNVPLGEWSRHEGTLVTVTSRVARVEGDGPASFELIGWHAICAGDAARCGMDHEKGEKHAH
jgi:hypothetical protein